MRRNDGPTVDMRTIRGGFVTVYKARSREVNVKVLPRKVRLACRHEWFTVAYGHRGHGKWLRCCGKCGALGR